MITRTSERTSALPSSIGHPLELPDDPGTAPRGAATDAALNPRSSRRGWLWLVVGFVAVAAWYYQAVWRPWLAPWLPGPAAPATKPPPRPIPVRTATIERRDLDLHLNGLGTVTAFKTVTLKSRVDGELVRVHFTEGQTVQEGELLAEIDSRLYEAQRQQAEGQAARDEALLELARLTLARGEDLLKNKSIAPQQVDEEAALVQQLEGTLQTDQALVANARLQLSYCRIVAPISGRIGLRQVDQGNIVRANDPLGIAMITQVQPIALVFTIPQDDIPRVQRRMQAGQALVVEAFDRDFQTKLATGTLLAIDNQVDAATGTLRLKAVFENEDNMLFPNQFVNARLLIETRRDVIVAPAAAVQRGPNGAFVYVVRDGESVDLRMVETGPTEGGETVIDAGLAPGDVVVTDGIDKLQQDTRVVLRDPAGQAADAGQSEEHGKESGDRSAP
ncbi:MAG: MdtA/MuxA family multidrug efflux RND transporter periplasmic adaptor subunit [Planctomycetales bacterium]